MTRDRHPPNGAVPGYGVLTESQFYKLIIMK